MSRSRTGNTSCRRPFPRSGAARQPCAAQCVQPEQQRRQRDQPAAQIQPRAEAVPHPQAGHRAIGPAPAARPHSAPRPVPALLDTALLARPARGRAKSAAATGTGSCGSVTPWCPATAAGSRKRHPRARYRAVPVPARAVCTSRLSIWTNRPEMASAGPFGIGRGVKQHQLSPDAWRPRTRAALSPSCASTRCDRSGEGSAKSWARTVASAGTSSPAKAVGGKRRQRTRRAPAQRAVEVAPALAQHDRQSGSSRAIPNPPCAAPMNRISNPP